MITILRAMGRRAPLVLVGGVVLGLMLPGLGNIIGVMLPLLVVMLLSVAMMRVDVAQVLLHLRRPFRLAILLIIFMAVMPFGVHLLAGFFNLPPALHMGLVLLVCAPPLSATASMAALLKLDDALVLNVMVVGTLIVPLSAPALAASMFENAIDLDAGSMFIRLALAIGLSLVAAYVLRRVIGRQRIERNFEVLDGISSLLMVIFAVVVMNGIVVTQSQGLSQIAYVLGIVLLVNWGIHGLSLLNFWIFRNLRKATFTAQDGAISLMAGNRNMALIMAVLPADIAAALLLFFALYQVPIYLTPILARPLYKHLLSP
jgi:BASS family bile acid:Na+ symporter